MTLIIVFDHEIRDTQAPSHSLRLQVGRGGSPERLWLSDCGKGIFLHPRVAHRLLTAVDKMNRRVQRGRLTDRVFFNFDLAGVDGGVLGIDLGVKVGRPYVGVENARIDISADDLAYLAACCKQLHFLCGGIGVAGLLAKTPGQSWPTQVMGDPEFEWMRRGCER